MYLQSFSQHALYSRWYFLVLHYPWCSYNVIPWEKISIVLLDLNNFHGQKLYNFSLLTKMLDVVWLSFIVLDIDSMITVCNMSLSSKMGPRYIVATYYIYTYYQLNKSFQGVMFSSLHKEYQGCPVIRSIWSDQYRDELGRRSDLFRLPPLPPCNGLVSYLLGQPYCNFNYSNSYTLRLKLVRSGYQGSSGCRAQGPALNAFTSYWQHLTTQAFFDIQKIWFTVLTI